MNKKDGYWDKPKIVRPALGRDQVYDYLREGILTGILKPGERLVEAQYSERFGVSRTPIREAFRMLEKDGLVQYVPQKGTFVRNSLTEKEIEEVFLIRHALQMASIAPIIANATDEELACMQRHIDDGIAAIASNDIFAYVRSNNKFNQRLLQSCRMELLSSLLLQMERYNPVFSFFMEESANSSTFLSQSGRCEGSLNEHIAILRCLRERNAQALQEALSRHIRNTKEAYLFMVRNKAPETI